MGKNNYEKTNLIFLLILYLTQHPIIYMHIYVECFLTFIFIYFLIIYFNNKYEPLRN